MKKIFNTALDFLNTSIPLIFLFFFLYGIPKLIWFIIEYYQLNTLYGGMVFVFSIFMMVTLMLSIEKFRFLTILFDYIQQPFKRTKNADATISSFCFVLCSLFSIIFSFFYYLLASFL